MDTLVDNVDTSANNVETLTTFEKRSWVKKVIIENIILDICKSEFKTLEELAMSIDRNPKYLCKKDISFVGIEIYQRN